MLTNVEQSNFIIKDQAKATQEIAQMLEGLKTIGQQLVDLTKSKSFS
ncbi:hypothetical protein SPACI_024810 [Sporomusa acidovorans DSM 3132]|uniref:Uncharacterized protein n=1 Tax=Sporomusa acidovorans (strain ATCC 49682 / DSM 3132 / Mol) TaxID=1123286 RepID=A0ABZ3J253_SPOA4|nr:hypothetical protein SPACI_46970 [Sporomusa acidovorans DSM 3132]SDF63594.1 hypothetical protein SAMN04488499_106418 [Sporomusa acidovorans]